MTKLGTTILATALLAASAHANGVLADDAVAVAQLQASGMTLRGCGVAWDGTSYWAAKVGNSSGVTLVQWDESGTLLNSFQSGIDHRSLFTDASGTVYGISIGTNHQVYSYDAAGVPTLLTSVSSSDGQMEMGLRGSNSRLYGQSQGIVYDWDFTTGAAGGSVPLPGFGSGSSYPANAQIAVAKDPVFGELIFTYDQNGRVQAFDFNGVELGACRLGQTSFDQTFSFSVANGLVWIERNTGGIWDGWDIGLNAGTLTGDVDQISLSTGGQQVLAMAVDATFAFKTYQMLGTFSGSVPGFVYTGTPIPLNPDAYSIFTLLNPNTPPLLNSAGVLDSLGKATAVFQVPPLSDPGLAGLTAEHAGVVIELIGPNLVVTTATVAVPCLLVP